jgi:hypothetical protein
VAQSSGLLGAVALRPASLALLIVCAVGCGVEAPAPAPAPPPSTSPAWSHAESKPWQVVSGSERPKFLAAMSAIDSRLAKDEERTLRRGVNVCYQIYDKKSAADVRAFTQREFETGPAKVSAKKARKIVSAAKKWICSCHALYLRWQA